MPINSRGSSSESLYDNMNQTDSCDYGALAPKSPPICNLVVVQLNVEPSRPCSRDNSGLVVWMSFTEMKGPTCPRSEEAPTS